jgi:hypothetical protein
VEGLAGKLAELAELVLAARAPVLVQPVRQAIEQGAGGPQEGKPEQGREDMAMRIEQRLLDRQARNVAAAQAVAGATAPFGEQAARLVDVATVAARGGCW